MTKEDRRLRQSNSLETEAALLIWSETPQIIAEQVAGLTAIGTYQLLPQDSQLIQDHYLDTPDRALQSHKLGLRIRAIGASRWIALKGPSQRTDWGGVERREIEAPWSQSALTRIVKELRERGINLQQQSQHFNDTPPLEVMTSLGLEVIQDRECLRTLRNIVLATEQGSPVLAELAIDSVVYQFSNQRICLHEVEIEAKVENGSTVVKNVIECLLTRYGPVLRKWHHGKLATGKAIQKLLDQKVLEGLVDINNNLKPEAYDKVDEYLSVYGVRYSTPCQRQLFRSHV